ncbi:metallophosphoesterase family protein [Photobacterium sp. DNB23_23_1]|uniref:Metallophosphoesterase n=1 Tax=Photobacterium pectinilyticum TaxID=2906793 RepID=A0ABT1MXV3_9GAMM|nr:metallophosphoesterase [Photobacterium sp. ZSDE20]MCQ1057318.1 metallophosphoesterase [Photobacterium sp. ZSDE20]MDD1821777.1 metallophosphoesterase [Photobacterium sp. ZSDE20]
MKFQLSTIAVLTVALLAGCNSSSDSSTNTVIRDGDPITPDMKIGLLADTQGFTSTNGHGTAIAQLTEVLQLYKDNGVTHVIAVGDLTDWGSINEYEDWIRLAKDSGMKFLSLAGNHEQNGGSAGDMTPKERFTHYMKPFIDDVVADGGTLVHYDDEQPYYSYAATFGNAMVINLSWGDFTGAFEWVKTQIENRPEHIQHVFVGSHETFLGGNRGGMAWSALNGGGIAENFDNWRQLFAQNNVTLVTGHDHIYSRSAIWTEGAAEQGLNIGQGDYFTEIVAGSASDKAYVYEKQQERLQSTMMARNLLINGWGIGGDMRDDWDADIFAQEGLKPTQQQVNASWFTITNDELSFEAYYDDFEQSHTWQDMGVTWKMLDRFTVGGERCEKLVHPSHIGETVAEQGYYDFRYTTEDCWSPEGTKARLIDGSNEVYSRINSMLAYARNQSGNKGDTWIENWYDWMVYDAEIPIGSNNNSGKHYQVDVTKPFNTGHPKFTELMTTGQDLNDLYMISQTHDMKKLVQLSWSAQQTNTVSEVLTISGIQGQTGSFANSSGYALDITQDRARHGTTVVDGGDPQYMDVTNKPLLDPTLLNEKSPNRTKTGHEWELDHDMRNGFLRADDYVFEFSIPAGLDAQDVTLAHLSIDNKWVPLLDSDQCLSKESYSSEFLSVLPNDIASNGCSQDLVMGLKDNTFWAKVDFEGKFAIVSK